MIDIPRAARDVAPGTSWAFREHRTMAEILKAEREAQAAAARPSALSVEICQGRAGMRRSSRLRSRPLADLDWDRVMIAGASVTLLDLQLRAEGYVRKGVPRGRILGNRITYRFSWERSAKERVTLISRFVGRIEG
jgi:hypothetical protein